MNKTPNRRSCSHRNAARRSPSVAFKRWSSALARLLGFDMKIHPHTPRHACGFKLANDGVDTRTIQAYLGHKSIQHTVRYTELAPTSVQKLIPGLTAPAPAASFEATVGGSGCPRLVEFFKKISMNARWVPFCVEVPAA